MNIIGINNSSHDTSACLLSDGIVIAFSAEERFNREKHSGDFPVKAIDFCLQKGNVSMDDIDEIAIGFDWDQRAKDRYELLSVGASESDIAMLRKDNELYKYREENVADVLENTYSYRGLINFYNHYDSHAAVAYFSSLFNESAVLVADGAGERASSAIYKVNGSKLEVVFQNDFPNSLGRFYAAITDHLGFRVDSDEGKVMGLAPYGNNDLVEKMCEVLRPDVSNGYILDTNYLELFNGNRKGFTKEFREMFGPKRNVKEELTQHHNNIAFAAQQILEECIISLARKAKELTGSKNICLSGGVILNSVANGKLVDEQLFENIYMYPACADDGVALGAAYKAYYRKTEDKITDVQNSSPYVGIEVSNEEILTCINNANLAFIHSDNVEKEAARMLEENKIIGWYQGRAEIGPRALGSRSILANPRYADNKDRVNSKIKFREPFRPFAPSIMEEYASDYFEMSAPISPYMLLAFPVKQEKRGIIPAVTHFDGSARVQTVNKEQNNRYYSLLKEFYALSGVPVLLNSSFNRNMEPIVNTPQEAINAFLGSGLDALVMGDYIVSK